MSMIDKGTRNFVKHIRYLDQKGSYRWATFEITVPPEYGKDNHILLMTWKEADYSASLVQDYEKMVNETFCKVFRVSLRSEKYQILHLEKNEKDIRKDENESIIETLKNYVAAGNVNKDFVDKVFEFADIPKVRKHFEESDERLTARYERLMDGEYVPAVIEITKSASYSREDPQVLVYVRRAYSEKRG